MLPKPDWLDYCTYCGGNHDEDNCPQKKYEEERTWQQREREKERERDWQNIRRIESIRRKSGLKTGSHR